MVRDERLCRSTAGDGLHHRRLYFQEASGSEKLANGRNDGTACFESLHYLRISPQVPVSLSVPLVDVRQAVEFFRGMQQALAQQHDLIGPDCDFTCFGLAQLACSADDVAEFE